jgi:chromosome partitioning protein
VRAGYLDLINKAGVKTVVDIFERFSAPSTISGAPSLVESDKVIIEREEWVDSSLLHLVPSRLELAWTLKNPTEKATPSAIHFKSRA